MKGSSVFKVVQLEHRCNIYSTRA